VCNAISDKAITTAITSGANTPSLVYRSCGAKPQCGSCSEYIKEEINQTQTFFESNLK
jgi:bacterioferritin-associated ferredoxin|tara:strand:- start:674 stop:847 length:174 start_codon:yes stop_codon:yes gene_type:complete